MGRHALNRPSILAAGVLAFAWICPLFTSEPLIHAAEKDPLLDPGSLPTAVIGIPGGTGPFPIGGSGAGESHSPGFDKREAFKPAKLRGVEPEDKLDPSFLIRSLLGVDVRSATPLELKQYRLEIPGGVVISVAYHHSPLVEAGFEADDMIMEVEGRRIRGLRDFAEQVLRLSGKKHVLMLGLDHRTGHAGYVQVVVP